MTVRDYYLLPEDGRRWELMDGDLSVTPAPTTQHQLVSGNLFVELALQLKRPGLAAFSAPVDVILDQSNVVEPDLVVVAAARTSIITKRAIEGAPDIVVEILSPSTGERDKQLKKLLCARFGVREYWVVDPTLGQVDAYRLVGSDYDPRARYDRASTLVCSDFPSLAIPLAPIFE